MKFLFIFYLLIHVEECIVSSFNIEEFYNVDMSTSLLRKIVSFVPSQKTVEVTYSLTPNICTSAVRETADIILCQLSERQLT